MLSRRAFLTGAGRAGGAAALAAGGLGGLLSACGGAVLNAQLLQERPVPSPDHPVTWPISASNRPIVDGLIAEADATLAVYTWSGRLAAACLDKFRRRFGCRLNVTTFDSADDAIITMTTRPTRFDVFLGAPIAALGTLIKSGLIQPLNHSYIPNMNQVWPQFTEPFYDVHWQYTVPYTIYSTGIGWRRDLTPDTAPYSLANGWDLLWQPKYNGYAAILDDYREGVGLGLLSGGITNLNTADPLLIDEATRSLNELANIAHPKVSNNASSQLASGATRVQHAWSGQVAAAAKKLPPGTPADALGYWFPPTGDGPVTNDTITIPRSARNPVLAHLFINFMLNAPNALANADGTGFLQPITSMTPSRLVREGVLPPNLVSTVVLEYNYYRGIKELQLQPATDALWQQAWQSVMKHLQ